MSESNRTTDRNSTQSEQSGRRNRPEKYLADCPVCRESMPTLDLAGHVGGHGTATESTPEADGSGCENTEDN